MRPVRITVSSSSNALACQWVAATMSISPGVAAPLELVEAGRATRRGCGPGTPRRGRRRTPSEASIWRSASSSSGVQTLVATIASSRRAPSVAPRMRSALPYIGDESTNVAPVSRAVSVIRWRASSTAGTSNVFDVPIPMTGTSRPANGRCSIGVLDYEPTRATNSVMRATKASRWWRSNCSHVVSVVVSTTRSRNSRPSRWSHSCWNVPGGQAALDLVVLVAVAVEVADADVDVAEDVAAQVGHRQAALVDLDELVVERLDAPG